MATRIIMPKLGMAMKEGNLGKWVKEDGAKINADETIAVIITKKITYELKAPTGGVLRHRARAKETRPVGAVIGYILQPGEEMPEEEPQVVAAEIPVVKPEIKAAPAGRAEPAPVQEEGFVVATPSARRIARQAGLDLAKVKGSGPRGRVTEADVQAYLEAREKVLITSAARALAEEHGLDITQIEGSGPAGRIMEADVQQAIAQPARELTPEMAPVAGTSVPFSGMRQMIAENMVVSLQTMAQVSLSTEVDVTELVALRERLLREFEVTYTDLIVKATAIALKKHPRLNATLDGEEILLLEPVHIGVGVALDEGLIVPVIRNADRLSIEQIGAALRDLAARARQDSLELDEVSGGTFTITNLGAYGIDMFTPVINPPEAAILGVGRIVEKLVIYRGEAARRSMMVLSLTFDHRLVDGAPAAAFLQTLADILTHPYYLGAGEGS